METLKSKSSLSNKMQLIVFGFLVFVTLFSYSKVSLLSQIASLIIFSIFIVRFIPNDNPLTRLSYGLFLPVALSPIYLVFRNIFNGGEIKKFDFPILLALIALAVYLVNFKKDKDLSKRDSVIIRSEFFSGLAAFVTLIFIQIYLYSKSLGHLFAWFGSGDSRNHLGFGRHIVNLGELNPLTMLQQPIGAPSFLGMVLGWRTGINNSSIENFVGDLATYGLTWIYFIGLIGVIFAAITSRIWQRYQNDLAVPKVLLVISSLFALSGLVLGAGLSDGFYTAIYGGLTTSLLILWVIESSSVKSNKLFHFLMGILIFLGTILAWSFITLISLPLLILGFTITAKLKLNKKTFLVLSVFLAIVLVVANLDPIKNLLLMGKAMLLAGGTISPPNPKIFTSFGLVILLAGIISIQKNKKLGQIFIWIAVTELTSVYILKFLSGLEFNAWSYYTLKFQWIALISLSGLLISLILVSLYKPFAKIYFKLPKAQKILSSILGILLIYNFTDTFYGGQNIWQKAFDGWSQPNSTVMNAALVNINTDKNPTILFRYIDPGNQMLGNFWLSLYVEPVDPLRGWLYSADTQNDVNWLCDLTKFYPEVRVITADPSLESTISQTCANPLIQVSVKPSVD